MPRSRTIGRFARPTLAKATCPLSCIEVLPAGKLSRATAALTSLKLSSPLAFPPQTSPRSSKPINSVGAPPDLRLRAIRGLPNQKNATLKSLYIPENLTNRCSQPLAARCPASPDENTSIASHTRSRQRWLILLSLGHFHTSIFDTTNQTN